MTTTKVSLILPLYLLLQAELFSQRSSNSDEMTTTSTCPVPSSSCTSLRPDVSTHALKLLLLTVAEENVPCKDRRRQEKGHKDATLQVLSYCQGISRGFICCREVHVVGGKGWKWYEGRRGWRGKREGVVQRREVCKLR